MNKTQIARDKRVKLAYEWLSAGKGTLSQASRRFHLCQQTLSVELREKYNFCARKAWADRVEKEFEDICENKWPLIKHDLDNTTDRALVIINKYGHGQHILNRLIERYKYPIEERANKVRQMNRANTLEKQGFKITKDIEREPLSIEGARYMALCMKWSNAA